MSHHYAVWLVVRARCCLLFRRQAGWVRLHHSSVTTIWPPGIALAAFVLLAIASGPLSSAPRFWRTSRRRVRASLHRHRDRQYRRGTARRVPCQSVRAGPSFRPRPRHSPFHDPRRSGQHHCLGIDRIASLALAVCSRARCAARVADVVAGRRGGHIVIAPALISGSGSNPVHAGAATRSSKRSR